MLGRQFDSSTCLNRRLCIVLIVSIDTILSPLTSWACWFRSLHRYLISYCLLPSSPDASMQAEAIHPSNSHDHPNVCKQRPDNQISIRPTIPPLLTTVTISLPSFDKKLHHRNTHIRPKHDCSHNWEISTSSTSYQHSSLISRTSMRWGKLTKQSSFLSSETVASNLALFYSLISSWLRL